MNMVAPLRHGPWNLSDLKNVPKNGYKVFSCFHCGGGSTMGYKLAGYEVLGGVEIDKQMMAIYRANHNPKHSFLMGIAEFNNLPNDSLPPELFDLDILDGSPPCSSFSTAGSREKKWGNAHQFREGQAKQVLDDLFFHFIVTAAKLKPKIVIAENVKGLILGNARGYVKEIFVQFRAAGYEPQLFLLNAAAMGVPQRRERTFFVAHRQLGLPKLELKFQEPEITLRHAIEGISQADKPLTLAQLALWNKCKVGDAFSSVHPKGSRFNEYKVNPDRSCPTIKAKSGLYHWAKPKWIYGKELARLQTFPDDYNPLDVDIGYMCGMSVPPFMMQRIAQQIEIQWLSKL